MFGLMQNLTVQLENNRQWQAIDSLAHTEATPQDRPSRHKHLPPTRFPSDLSTTSLQQSGGRPTIETTNPNPYHMSLQQANSLTAPHGYAPQLYHQHFPQHFGDNFSSSGQNLQLQYNVWQGAPPPSGNVNYNIGNPSNRSRQHSLDGLMGIVYHPGYHNNDRLSSSDHPSSRKHSFDGHENFPE